jgi:hypothetical protein
MAKRPAETRAAQAICLYEVSRHLSRDDREALGLRFPVRVFVQDPLVAEKHKREGGLGVEEIHLDWEPGLTDGPTSARVAVVDYNADTGVTAKPAPWNAEAKTYVDADDPDNFQFHQVNVWAIVQHTLAFFEDPYVMGRPIPWGFDGNKLIVVPHAGTMRNAFYDRQSKSLQFYYFLSDERPIYTCLSHDIVAHETGRCLPRIRGGPNRNPLRPPHQGSSTRGGGDIKRQPVAR